MGQSSLVLISKQFKMSPFLNPWRIALPPCPLQVRFSVLGALAYGASRRDKCHLWAGFFKANVLRFARFPSSDLVTV